MRKSDWITRPVLALLLLIVAAPTNGASPPSVDMSASPAELVFWQSVSESRDRAQYDAYLAAFPQGLFAVLARAKIAALAINSSVPLKVPEAPALEPSFVDQLRVLALSQGNRCQKASSVVPARPMIQKVAMPDLPPQFCSAVERNAFHDGSYRPVIEHASRNNADAIAHMQLLIRLFGDALTKGDNNMSNALAKESKDYEQVAKAVYLERTALDPAFARLMAVPLVDCGGPKK